jgi:uncharacterized protein (TIGR02996 family)
MTTSYPEAFYRQLEEDPDDWATRLVMADWYEDNGEPERAEAIRWQVENKRRPRDGRPHDKRAVWAWFDFDHYGTTSPSEDPLSDLPHEIYVLLEKADDTDFRQDRRYVDLRVCEEDLQRAVIRHLAQSRSLRHSEIKA